MKRELTGYPSIDRLHESDSKYFERNPIIPNISIYDLFQLMNIFNKNDTAVTCLDLTMTYSEINHYISVVTKSLKELGIKKGSVITICTPSLLQSLIIFFAANNIGAMVTFLNAKSTPKELEHYINLFESTVLVNYSDMSCQPNNLYSNTTLEATITLNGNDLLRIPKINGNNSSSSYYGYNPDLTFADFIELSKYYRQPIKKHFGKDPDSLILYTSGTTGNPKPVVLSNENIISSALYMKNTTKVSSHDKETSLCVVPYNYPYGFVTSVIMSLFCGKNTVLAPTINLTNLREYIEKYRPNIIQAIPSFYSAMRRNSDFDGLDLSFIKLAISGGDYFSAADNEKTSDFFRNHNSDARVCNGSGAAEVSGCSTTSVGCICSPKSVGKLLVGMNCKILDPDTFEEKKYGETGLLAFAGKNIFKRYYNDEDTTNSVKKIDENGIEWYISDTIGLINTDGTIEILDRLRRFFITYDENGQAYKVYPNYIQGILSSFDEIEDCVVVGMQDEYRDRVPKLFVIPKRGYIVDDDFESKIIQKIQNLNKKGVISIKSYEIPVEIEIISEIPLKESGKVDYDYFENKTNSNYVRKLS